MISAFLAAASVATAQPRVPASEPLRPCARFIAGSVVRSVTPPRLHGKWLMRTQHQRLRFTVYVMHRGTPVFRESITFLPLHQPVGIRAWEDVPRSTPRLTLRLRVTGPDCTPATWQGRHP